MSILSFSELRNKWDTKEDIEDIIRELNNNKNCYETLQLNGNSLGVTAAELLIEPLSSQSKLKHLFLNDLFTGRLKTEIGIALKSLSVGLMRAEVHLVELDLSDNAFGPNGVVGVTDLLSSPCCYTLKTLNMNNQGLGHQGCRSLIDALKISRKNSNFQGMNLEVFIAGRNRLENAGMEMLTEFFGDGMSSLKKLVLLQNGIGIHGVEGVENLILSIKNHVNLEILNISDNTIKPNGMKRLCKIIPYFENLKELHIGDCLLGNNGLNTLTKVLPEISREIRVICLSGNEVTGESARNFVSTLVDVNNCFEKIDLTENEIKKSYQLEIKDILQEYERVDCWVNEEQNSDDEDEYSEDSNDDSNEDANSEDSGSYGSNGSFSESENSDAEQEPEPVKEASQHPETTNTFCFGKSLNPSSSLFSKTSVDTGNLFGPSATTKKDLPNGSARQILFSVKTNQTNVFKAPSSTTESPFVFGPSSASQPFSFLNAAKAAVVQTDVDQLNTKKSINTALTCECVKSININLDRAVSSSCLDAELLKLAEQHPENGIRVGLMLCSRADSFEAGAMLVSHLLASSKTWAIATNSILVEMDCIKNEDHDFVPFCRQDNKLPIRVLSRVLNKSSAISNEVRVNLTTVLKNLNKNSSRETDDLLMQLENCIGNLKF